MLKCPFQVVTSIDFDKQEDVNVIEALSASQDIVLEDDEAVRAAYALSRPAGSGSPMR